MKIKFKLTLWVGLLFSLIILLAVISIIQVRSLAVATENILVANYNSLVYAREMLKDLELIPGDTNALHHFDEQLQRQEGNITEVGESDWTAQLRDHFTDLQAQPIDSTIKAQIRGDLNHIMHLNLEAIDRKSEVAKKTADQAMLYIPAVAGLCFMIAFILLVNLPGSIANPIRELTESIRQIAKEKYSQRVHFEGHNEFGELAKSFNTMAKKLEEYNDSNLSRIMVQKKRIETLINNMHDPVIGLDENKMVLFVNEEALHILGMQQEQCVGQAAQDLAMNNDLMRMLIKDLWQEGAADEKQPLKIYAHGKESYFEKERIRILHTPTGETEQVYIGDVIILRNVTSYKELDVAKTNLMATLSHEFKTPIAAIRMSVDLMKKKDIGTLNPQQEALINSIEDDTSRLLRIIGEILHLSQMETGKIQINLRQEDAGDLIAQAISMNSAFAAQKDITVHETTPAQPISVYADGEKTKWVLSNLISNAIRYSYEHASVDVSVRQVMDWVEFTVRDSGQGIAPEFIDRIFDRYFRIPGSGKEGTGLGLSICKEFIEAQGGTIQVSSELGSGSTFQFKLPLAPMS